VLALARTTWRSGKEGRAQEKADESNAHDLRQLPEEEDFMY
jgi:hypothetical protein